MFYDDRGEGNQGALVAIVLLVLALFAVFFLWQRDGRADDADLEVDIGADTSLRPTGPAGWVPLASGSRGDVAVVWEG